MPFLTEKSVKWPNGNIQYNQPVGLMEDTHTCTNF